MRETIFKRCLLRTLENLGITNLLQVQEVPLVPHRLWINQSTSRNTLVSLPTIKHIENRQFTTFREMKIILNYQQQQLKPNVME